MSYRRAWLLIDDMNQCFRHAVVSARPGGSQGGGAVLTEFGAELVRDYRAIETAAEVAAKKRLRGLEAALRKSAGSRSPPSRRRLRSAAASREDVMHLDRRTLIAGLSATLLAPRLARAATVTDAAGRAVPIPGQGRARVSGRAAGRDPALHAGARSPARLAARQPAGGMRVHAAGHLRPARGRPHHRARQHRQSRSRAGAQARSHSRRRLDQRRPSSRSPRACRSRPAFPMRCSTAASTPSRRPTASSAN